MMVHRYCGWAVDLGPRRHLDLPDEWIAQILTGLPCWTPTDSSASGRSQLDGAMSFRLAFRGGMSDSVMWIRTQTLSSCREQADGLSPAPAALVGTADSHGSGRHCESLAACQRARLGASRTANDGRKAIGYPVVI